MNDVDLRKTLYRTLFIKECPYRELARSKVDQPFYDLLGNLHFAEVWRAASYAFDI